MQMTSQQQQEKHEEASASYEAAKAARIAARDAAELAACQRLLPSLQPEHLAALARNAAARGIDTSDVSAIGFLAQPENCLSGSIRELLAPVAGKYNDLLSEERVNVGFAAAKAAEEAAEAAFEAAMDLPEIAAARAADQAARDAAYAASQSYSPHVGGGFADDEMYLH